MKPPAAGIHPVPPEASASSIAGIKSDHMEAATITPAAKPKRIRCASGEDSFLKKNTTAEPSAVMKKVKPVPAAAQSKG